MAKAKKEQLLLEEMLEQALVKDEDRPYEVPSNWVWTRLGDIIKVSSGKSLISANMVSNGNIPVYGGNGVTGYHDTFNINIPTIVIGRVGFYCGSIHFVNEEAWVTDNALIVTFPKEKISIRFLYWVLSSIDLRKNDSSTAQPVISGSKIYALEIPLPPFIEQQRIVAVVESLFEKLDTAKELMQNALDSFENRKAAILHQAFTGALTAKWREENEVSLDEWEEKELKQICDKITDGTHKSPKNYDSGDYMYITAKNIKEYGIDFKNITYISEKDHKEIYSRCNVEYGDILYIKDGATTGIGTINTIEEEFSLLSSVALLKTNKRKLDAQYLVHNLNSPITKSLMINNMSGNAITRLTITKIKDSIISIPPLKEQKEIVRILDSLLENEQQAKELCNIIEKIDLMKKVILGRAFRGELGTNDPTEESAELLLKEVLKEKI